MVRRYVSDRKPEILAASGKAPVEAFVPQSHPPGHEAEVDVGFTPVPEVDSLAELNEMVDQSDLHDGHRRIGSRPRTVDEYFAVEQPLLAPLPQESFETGRLFTPRFDRYSQINVRTSRYSVPTRFIGTRVRVVLHASHLVVYDRNVEVARHERLIAKGGLRLDLDHYLEALVRKPGAFPGATALEQARSAGKFTPVHDAWWSQARKVHGKRDGTTCSSPWAPRPR